MGLFLVPWFFPVFNVFSDGKRCVLSELIELFGLRYDVAFVFYLVYTLLFGIPAAAGGWVLHCLIVMLRDRKRRKE